MNIARAAVAGFFLLLSTACTSTSAEACFTADWYSRGAEAGLQGLPASEVLREQGSCAHYGVVPDHREYVAGWRSTAQR
jgi:hypothetical protein